MTSQYVTRNSAVSVLTTELNSLADGYNAITSSPRSNDGASEKDLLVDFSLSLAAQGGNRATPAFVHLYLIPAVDGTHAYGSASVDPSLNHYRGSFQFPGGETTARLDIVEGVRLPNSDFHVLLMNNTGQAFAASGNELKLQITPGYEDV